MCIRDSIRTRAAGGGRKKEASGKFDKYGGKTKKDENIRTLGEFRKKYGNIATIPVVMKFQKLVRDAAVAKKKREATTLAIQDFKAKFASARDVELLQGEPEVFPVGELVELTKQLAATTPKGVLTFGQPHSTDPWIWQAPGQAPTSGEPASSSSGAAAPPPPPPAGEGNDGNRGEEGKGLSLIHI